MEFIADQYHFHQQQTHQGLSEYNLLPRIIKGDRLSEHPWQSRISYSVALDNLRSAFNVGSIIRTLDAVGFESLYLGKQTPGLDNQQVKKTAMCCADWIPCERVDLSSFLESIKEKGYTIIGIETVENSETYTSFPWPEKAILVFGNEEYGISKSLLSCCDSFVHLPMLGRKNSINVANAVAVIAFQVMHYFMDN